MVKTVVVYDAVMSSDTQPVILPQDTDITPDDSLIDKIRDHSVIQVITSKFTCTGDENLQWPLLKVDSIAEHDLAVAVGNEFIGEPWNAQTASRIEGAIVNKLNSLHQVGSCPSLINHFMILTTPAVKVQDQDTNSFQLNRGAFSLRQGPNLWVDSYSYNRVNGTLKISVKTAECSLHNAQEVDILQPGPFDTITIWNREGLNPKQRRFKKNLYINVNSRAEYEIFGKISAPERKALDTLREMISEADFRKYLKYGFINVKGNSGKIYQVFRDHEHTKVYMNGVLIEEICVRISDKQIPPTDNVIVFKCMIESNEEEFTSIGNRYKCQDAA